MVPIQTFLMETVCVYCAVPTEMVNIIQVNLSLKWLNKGTKVAFLSKIFYSSVEESRL